MVRSHLSAATLADTGGARRAQLIEMTIDSLAEVGYVESTLTRIGRRAGVSAGLVAHYFADKDGLFEATFRSLVARLGARMRARMQQAHLADFTAFQIAFDNYGSTHSGENRAFCMEIWQALRRDGLVSEKDVEQLYDPLPGFEAAG